MRSESVRRFLWIAASLVAAAAVVGCGASGGTKSQVTGKVVANGQPVTEGSITFMPVDGKAGSAPSGGEVQADGTFKMMTENKEGASIGKHSVSYTPKQVEVPEWDGYGTQPAAPKSTFAGLVPKETQVEVKSGANDLTIELVPGGAR
jgi:hypothetical protein